jgi:hypothetical protein
LSLWHTVEIGELDKMLVPDLVRMEDAMIWPLCKMQSMHEYFINLTPVHIRSVWTIESREFPFHRVWEKHTLKRWIHSFAFWPSFHCHYAFQKACSWNAVSPDLGMQDSIVSSKNWISIREMLMECD